MEEGACAFVRLAVLEGQHLGKGIRLLALSLCYVRAIVCLMSCSKARSESAPVIRFNSHFFCVVLPASFFQKS